MSSLQTKLMWSNVYTKEAGGPASYLFIYLLANTELQCDFLADDRADR